MSILLNNLEALQPNFSQNLNIPAEDRIRLLEDTLATLVQELIGYVHIRQEDRDAVINSVYSYASSPGPSTIWYNTSTSKLVFTDPAGSDTNLT